jgi:hypothetical protein
LGHALILPKKTVSNKSSNRDQGKLRTHTKRVKAVNRGGKSGTTPRPTI